MATRGDNIKGGRIDSSAQRSTNAYGNENAVSPNKEALRAETAHEAAERGHAATDKSATIYYLCHLFKSNQ